MKTKLLVLTALCLLLQLSAIAQVTPSPDSGRGLVVQINMNLKKLNLSEVVYSVQVFINDDLNDEQNVIVVK